MTSMNSGFLRQGLNSALPKNPRKVNNPFGTTLYQQRLSWTFWSNFLNGVSSLRKKSAKNVVQNAVQTKKLINDDDNDDDDW